REIVKSVIRDLGAENISDMGKVIRAIMPKVQGRADGKVVNGMVTQILKSSE
ncbi:MAG TPA: glutamyl-tRNA amidotransferase, partial [Dehalococcoidia bacterium]|nr:glutamyl-tRNA amidotransferase [Dehalococcoidia bacterium]